MKLGIIGTGAYAIALTSLIEEKNISTIMWTKLENEYQELKNNHTNLNVLDYKLNNNINFTNSLEELSNKSDYIILVIPTKFIKSTINEFKKYYHNQPILIASKGIMEDKILIHDYLKKELKTSNISCISGPSFAKDVILKQPIGLTIASNKFKNNGFYKLFSNISYLELELSNDIIGVELWGIFKNIIAIGSGILNGMNTSPSTINKFLIDASKDIQKIIIKCKGNKNTYYTYAGIGDYILTTTNTNSRNYTFGLLIGQNKDYKTYQNENTIEGLENLKVIYEYLNINNINCKIIDILYNIIYLNEDKNLLITYLNN